MAVVTEVSEIRWAVCQAGFNQASGSTMTKTIRLVWAALLITVVAPSIAHECDDPKSTEAAAACVSIELKASDRLINKLYQEAMTARDTAGKQALRLEQRQWLTERNRRCRLDIAEPDREKWYVMLLKDYAKTACVVGDTRSRISALQAMRTGGASTKPPAPAAARINEKTIPGPDGKPRAPTLHSEGKWYFELTVNRAAVAALQPTMVVAGFVDPEYSMIGTMINVRANDLGIVHMGCAIDLDHGMVYFRQNGSWDGKEPGSNRGGEVKLGRWYKASFTTSADMDQLTATGALVANFGDLPFTFPLPAGYRSWR
jgi:uncharacterized protein YecT (DUF1311 family)